MMAHAGKRLWLSLCLPQYPAQGCSRGLQRIELLWRPGAPGPTLVLSDWKISSDGGSILKAVRRDPALSEPGQRDRGEPSGEPTTPDTRPRQATVSLYRCS